MDDKPREELEKRMDELTRKYADYNTRNKPAPAARPGTLGRLRPAA
jgi:hypothetical protein